MVLQPALLLLGRLRIDISLVCHQRHLRVDDDILSLRIVDDDVGLHLPSRILILQSPPRLVAQSRLHLVVDALGQSLTCQQVAEDDLAHRAARLVVAAQHIGQALRLLAQLLGLTHHQQHLLAKRCRVGRRLLLGLADGLLHVGDGLFQRRGDARHRLRVLRLQPVGTAFEDAPGHIGKLLLLPPVFLCRLLPQQFQFAAERLHAGIEPLGPRGTLPDVRLQMLYAALGCTEQFLTHGQFDVLLAGGDVHGVESLVHHEIGHHGSRRHTYYNI